MQLSAPTPAPCGSWKSPITAESIAQEGMRFGQLTVSDDRLFWMEMRPLARGGKPSIMRFSESGTPEHLLQQKFAPRSLVNSYGGGDYWLSKDALYFVNYVPEHVSTPSERGQNQCVHMLDLLDPAAQPIPLTNTPGSAYSDGTVDETRGRLVCIREDSTYSVNGQAMQTLVSIPLKGGKQALLASGADFYAAPRLSPDGRKLAYLSWSYPAMSWDSAELHVAKLDEDGRVQSVEHIAGGEGEAICQPSWSPSGHLFFAGDRTNWWNIYRLKEGVVEAIYPYEAEFATALWTMNPSRYAVVDDETLVAAYREGGLWRLGLLNVGSRSLKPITLPFTEIDQVQADGQGNAYFLGGAPDRPKVMVKLDLKTFAWTVLRNSATLDPEILSGYVSHPEPIVFPTWGGATARAFYYPPKNPGFVAPEGDKPPLIVMSHGGPTAAASTGLSLTIQYFTTRGFAVVDVDYRGSTGYGREYRLSLYGNWGIYDIRDCEAAGHYLIKRGDVDPDRIVARGGSAGGYITLGLLAFTDLCRAGASYYGISSLEMIAEHGDKFEAYYPYKLIGPYPEELEAYRARSPFYHVKEVKSPVVFFQGLEDPVVSPEQTRVMADSLRERGIPVAVRYYEGEQHGFRKASSVQDSLEAEFSFYAQVLGFEPSDQLEALAIDNWT